MSLPLTFKVKEITQDTPNLKTYTFEHNLRAKPGQFVMVWMPGVDEVPMSIGWQTESEFQLSIADVGDCTHAIHEQIKVGDKLGIRGPYGSSFEYRDYKNVILIGGGCGTPPMLNLAQKTTVEGIKTTVLLGGRSSDFIMCKTKFQELGCMIKVATDDGSEGHHGFVTDVLAEELEKNGYDCIYTCGPEIMMVKVTKLSVEKKVDCQVSLERYMKCGFGICGQCCIDDSGLRVCKEGPVLTAKRALEHTEFGSYHRDQAGVIIK